MCQGRKHLYIPAELASSNHGWQNGRFYLCNDGDEFSGYSGLVVTGKPEKWHHGVAVADQGKLSPLLDALKELADNGLMVAMVVVGFHWRRVLPFMN